MMSHAEQQRRFRYVLNIEGHGGWADRLYKLLMSNQLVLAQDVAPRLWYEGYLEAGTTHLVVDSNLRNLSAVIEWARGHEAEVDRMIANANRIAEATTSVEGIRVYLRSLLRRYTSRLLAHSPRRHPRAIRFSCAEQVGDSRKCEAPRASSWRKLQVTRCHFRLPGGRLFDTLHDAATAAGFDPAPPSPPTPPPRRRQPSASAEPLESLLCSTAGRMNARATSSRWCFDFTDPQTCQRHFVPGGPSGCARRPCLWTTALQDAAERTAHRCHGATRVSRFSPACVAVCCSDVCHGANGSAS